MTTQWILLCTGILSGSGISFAILGYWFWRLTQRERAQALQLQQAQQSLQQAQLLANERAAKVEALEEQLQTQQRLVLASRVELAQLQAQLEGLEGLREALHAKEEHVAALDAKAHRLEMELSGIQVQKKADAEHHMNQIQQLKEARAALSQEFENLANKILQQKAEAVSKNHQESLNHLLQPLKEQLNGFKKKVEDTYDQENRDRHSLLVEIRHLKTLNEQMSVEAQSLTRALKGDKKLQGNWGEVILEKVLESSGLRKGEEYETQVNLHDAEGKRHIPDVIVRLPDDKDIVIDAKVSLVDYEAYVNAESEAPRETHLKSFSRAMRHHLERLSQKHYEHLPGLRTLDFVFMFVPIEAAFMIAVEKDPQLFTDAYDKNIILVNPSTLLATLRTVQSIWRYERQNKNAERMAEVAGGLYDQCVRMVESLEGVGRHLHRAQEGYEKTMNQLTRGRGNLIGRIDRLEKLGARPKKSLPKHLVATDITELDTSVDVDD